MKALPPFWATGSSNSWLPVGLLLIFCTFAAKSAPLISVSPDGALTAGVLTVTRHKPGRPAASRSPENVIVIYGTHDNALCRHDFSSPDGQHGYTVDNAGWSYDSNYFVVSIENSGGHQPRSFPTYVYSRKQNRFVNLEHTSVGATTTPDFKLIPPSLLETRVLSSSNTSGVAVTVDLAKVLGERQ